MASRVMSTSPTTSFKSPSGPGTGLLTEEVAKLWVPLKGSDIYWDFKRTAKRVASFKEELVLRTIQGPYVNLFLNGAKEEPKLSSNAKLLLKLAGQLLDSGMTYRKSNEIMAKAFSASQTPTRPNPTNFISFGAALRLEPIQDITDFVTVYFTTLNRLRSQKLIEAAASIPSTLEDENRIKMADELRPNIDPGVEEFSRIILGSLLELAAPPSDALFPIANIRLAKAILSLLDRETKNQDVEEIVQAIEASLKIGVRQQVRQILFNAANFYEPQSDINEDLMEKIYATLLLIGNSSETKGTAIFFMTFIVSQLTVKEIQIIRAIFDGFGEAEVAVLKMLEPTFKETVLDISNSVLAIKAPQLSGTKEMPSLEEIS